MLQDEWEEIVPIPQLRFKGHPPLGVNATQDQCDAGRTSTKFQWAPTLGGECYSRRVGTRAAVHPFQWAPTLGGECYSLRSTRTRRNQVGFNGHPPLGVNATKYLRIAHGTRDCCFNGHPPLGVNATNNSEEVRRILLQFEFQWAPTLGGECYLCRRKREHPPRTHVSMGTHPWG